MKKNQFKLLIVISTILMGILIVFYSYIDLKILTQWTMDLLDATFEGKLYHYYEVVSENKNNLICTYIGFNYIPLIPWALWNIPIWILQRWFGVLAIGHAWTLIYSNLFLVIVELITLYYTYKIAIAITKDKEKAFMAAYLSFSFPFMMIAVGYAGQSDVISLCLFVIALYHLMNKRKLKFVIFATLSIPMKPYVFIAYLALVLLVEKKIWKIIAYTAVGGSIPFLFSIIYRNAPMYRESMSSGPSGKQVISTIGSYLDIGISGSISLFICALILFYFYVYIKHNNKAEQLDLYEVVYTAAVPFILYFAITNYDFYRVLYLAPFLFILFVCNNENFRINIILESIFSISAITVFYWKHGYFFSNWWVFQYVRNMLPEFLDNLLPTVRKIGESKMPISDPVSVLASTVATTSLFILLVLNHPKCKFKYNGEMELSTNKILLLRSLIMLPLIMLSLYGG